MFQLLSQFLCSGKLLPTQIVQSPKLPGECLLSNIIQQTREWLLNSSLTLKVSNREVSLQLTSMLVYILERPELVSAVFHQESSWPTGNPLKEAKFYQALSNMIPTIMTAENKVQLKKLL